MSQQQARRLASEKLDISAEVDSLRTDMDSARRRAQAQAPRASERLAQASQELQSNNTASGLRRSARDIEAGRTNEAIINEPRIGEQLQRLAQRLEEATELAGGGRNRQQQGRQANEGDLLAELGDARRALQRQRDDAAAREAQNQGQRGQQGQRSGQQGNQQADQQGERGRGEQQQGQGQGQNQQNRDQNLAQNERGSGSPGAQSQSGQEGQGGQQGGQRGQDGQGGQGERGQNGGNRQQAGQPGQGGLGGRDDGGFGDQGRFGGGEDRFRSIGGGFVGEFRPLTDAQRAALREQGQLSAQRLEELRDQLGRGALNEADLVAISELARQLRRGTVSRESEAERMLALVSQLELAALNSQQAKKDNKPTRSADSVDDSRRYRDNVAEYYRKLGEANDGK